MAAVVLTDKELDLATPQQIARVLDCHRTRIFEYQRRYRDGGIEGVRTQRRGPRAGHKLNGKTLKQAQRLLDQSLSNRRVAAKCEVSEGAIRAALKQGRLVNNDSVGGSNQQGAPPPESSSATRTTESTTVSTPRERSDADASCDGGIGVKRVMDRAFARVGVLREAPPEFVASQSVSRAGVLIALPTLIEQGLIDIGVAVYGELKNSYFGLSSMLLTFAFMALLRIKSIEGLTAHAPGEFGIALGLDRAPEMRTARRKLKEMGERGLANEFAQQLTRRWAAEDPDALGYLYVDGHVRPYHGRAHRLPKTHVQRRRLCMPATTDYWVNDADAEPLFFVTAAANDGLLAMLEAEILPQARKLVGEGRRFTLIFDREGWSPKSFKRWTKLGIDVLTYRKGKYDDWPTQSFGEFPAKVAGKDIVYQLGERSVLLAKGFWMREVRRLCPDGHQTSVMTTRQDLTVLDVAARMFSRWKQENFFRYMRHEFAIDHLPTEAVEAADPTRFVPNPALKGKLVALHKARAHKAKLESEYGQRAFHNPEPQRASMRGFKIANAGLARAVRLAENEISRIQSEIASLPQRVEIGSLMDEHEIVRLERERKTICDNIKMVGYRAETQLANLVGPLLPCRGDEARSFLKKVFDLPADILPDHDNNMLRVSLHSMANPRSNRALRELCGVLNQIETTFPGTDFRLAFQAAE